MPDENIIQWQYADDYRGGKAIVKTYEKYYGEIHEIEKNLAMNPMFSGLKVVGKLGEN